MMFGNAIVAIAIIVLATATMLDATLAMTRASIHRVAQQYLAVGYQRAASTLRDAVAAELRSGAMDPRALSPLPEITPLPSQCVASGTPCSFYTEARVAFENTANVSSAQSAGCDGTTSNCGANLESNDRVDEGRLAVQVVVNVTAPDGSQLATRTQMLTLRTFAAPPYATIAGARDATTDATSGSAPEGDDGGLVTQPQAPTCGPPVPDETVVRVQYRNTATNACMDGSRWQQQNWSNANGNTTGWSR